MILYSLIVLGVKMKILYVIGCTIAVVIAAVIGMICGAVMGIFVGPAKLFELVSDDENLTEESDDII